MLRYLFTVDTESSSRSSSSITVSHLSTIPVVNLDPAAVDDRSSAARMKVHHSTLFLKKVRVVYPANAFDSALRDDKVPLLLGSSPTELFNLHDKSAIKKKNIEFFKCSKRKRLEQSWSKRRRLIKSSAGAEGVVRIQIMASQEPGEPLSWSLERKSHTAGFEPATVAPGQNKTHGW